MTDQTSKTTPLAGAPIPEDHALEVRRLAHDLSNSLEVIVQTSYLLGTVGLTGNAADWHRMLDEGVNKALALNLELREYIKKNAAH